MSDRVRDECAAMKPGALQKRARDLGVSDDEIAEALDADDSKQALTDLIIVNRPMSAEDKLREECAAMKPGALQKKAKDLGVPTTRSRRRSTLTTRSRR